MRYGMHSRIDRLEQIRGARGTHDTLDRIAEASGIDPAVILAEAERLREQAGPFASHGDMLAIAAEEAGCTVEGLRADALQLMEASHMFRVDHDQGDQTCPTRPR